MTPIRNLATHTQAYVTVAELAAYWRVGERTVHYLVASGALPALHIGRVIRIRTEDARGFGVIEEVLFAPIGAVH